MNLFILVAPTVSAQAVIGAVEDRPVVLSCEAKAYPKAMVEWMRYGKIWRFFHPAIFYLLAVLN